MMTVKRLFNAALALLFSIAAVVFGAAALMWLIFAVAQWSGDQAAICLMLAALAYLCWRLARRRWQRGRSDEPDAPAPRVKTPWRPAWLVRAAGGAQALAPGEFYSRVVGVTQTNADGGSRQAAIRRHCRDGAPLQLTREPDNPHDPNAIAVRCAGVQIGYLSAELTEEYANDIDTGAIKLHARVKQVTGGTRGKKHLGVNIILAVHPR